MDPTKKELYTAKRSSGLDITGEDISPLVERVRSDADSLNWCLFKVVDTKLVSHASGSNGLNEMISSVTDDDVYYGVIKAIVSDKVKFYQIFFVGSNVGGMKKGKASLYKATVFTIIEAHGEIACPNGTTEFTPEFVLNGISKLSGSKDIKF